MIMEKRSNSNTKIISDGESFNAKVTISPVDQESSTKMKKSRSFSADIAALEEDNTFNEGTVCLGMRERTMSMMDFREFEEIKAINEMLYAFNTGSTEEAFESCNQGEVETTEDDYLFYDLETESAEITVPIKFHDGPEPEPPERPSSMKKSVSMGNFDSSRRVDIDLKPQSSLKKNLSYSTLNQLDDKKPAPSLKRNPSYSSFTSMNSGQSSNTRDSSKMKRNVSFSSLEVREYSITLGDNPSVSRGAPISLSWNYNEGKSIDLEEFETIRGPRRTRGQMVMGSNYRNHLLKEAAGFSRQEIKEAAEKVNKIKKNRNKSISRLHVSRLEEALESAMRKVKRIIPKS